MWFRLHRLNLDYNNKITVPQSSSSSRRSLWAANCVHSDQMHLTCQTICPHQTTAAAGQWHGRAPRCRPNDRLRPVTDTAAAISAAAAHWLHQQTATSAIITRMSSESAILHQCQNFNQNWSGIPIQIARLIRIRMSTGPLLKCCGFIILSASVISTSFVTRGESNLTKSASRGAHSPVRGHPRGSKVVPLNSWGRVSY